MFGTNAIVKQELGIGTELHVVKGSPWRTIQGEGPYAGHPAIFLRLHGCNLACTFCDTQFSNPADPIMSVTEILLRASVLHSNGNVNLFVITGGEPFRQNILPLCWSLSRQPGLKVQIETAGTLWIDGFEKCGAEIVCSPKTPTIHQMIYQHAIAFKYIIGADMEFDGCIPITATQLNTRRAKLAVPRPGAAVYLSPLDEYDVERNAANVRLVGRMAMQFGVIAGLQMHKFFELD